MKKSIFLFFVMLISVNINANNEMSFNQDLSINVSNSNKFFADVGAGSLSVRGANVDEIEVKATIHSSNHSSKFDSIEDLHDAFDKYMVFTLDKQGSTIVLKAIAKKKWFSFNSPNISIDLEIIIPQNMNVEIDDGSGKLTVADIDGKLVVDDGSGHMTIKNIGDDVEIDDGSGSLEISHVKGDLHVDDGSGNLIIKNIEGSVYIDDGSGFVNISNVLGDVSIDDGSGSIEINELAGRFNLIDDGSGSIRVNGKRWHDD